MKHRIPPPLPPSVAAFAKYRKAFEAWLTEHGSAVKAPTNPFEVIRFVGQNTECIVYRKANDTISCWSNGADQAYRAFLDQTDWRACERGQRDRKTLNLIASLAERDGWGCPYCPATLTAETATIEHFFSVTSGGTSHLGNLSLACQPCNSEVGAMSVRQKLEFAVSRRRVVEQAMEEV